MMLRSSTSARDRTSPIGAGEEADRPDAAVDELAHAGDELGLVAPLEEVGDEQKQRALRSLDEVRLRIPHGTVDVRAATELTGEQDVHGIGEEGRAGGGIPG